MEIRLLRYFWTVAEEKNISKAAKLLNITQPTLSRQIKELEESVGVALFHRTNNQLSLTEEGIFLKERAEEILLLNDKLDQAFLDHRNKQLSGSFSIGCVEADNSDTLSMMIEELISDYPQVRFNLVTGTSEDISDRLDKGLLDLALLLEPVDIGDYESLVLPREEKWGLLVSKEIFLAQKKAITPADLKGIPLLSSSRKEVQDLIAQWLGAPFEELNIVGTYNLIFNIFSLVENRVGSALAIEGATAHRDIQQFSFIPLEPELKTHGVLVWKRRIHTPVVEELLRRFKHAFQA